MRSTLMLVLLVSGTSCGPGQMFEDSQTRLERHQEAYFAERRAERERSKGEFPRVTVGMSYEDLKTQIEELNPPYIDRYGSERKTAWVERVSQYLDTTTIVYGVARGPLADYPPRTVIVTVQDGVVIGFSK